LTSGAGAGSNQWGAKNNSTSQKPTYVKGISGIEKMWVQNLIIGVQEAPPLTVTQPKARGILVIGGIKGAGTTTGGVCSTPTN